jgi:putative RNA 2'-phosphotransferase
MDNYGFVDIDELHKKLGQRYSIDKQLIFEIVEKGTRKRFEIVGNKIRALYGHTIGIKQKLVEDEAVEVLYHGTTRISARKILKEGLKSMRRIFVHLSPTAEIAREVGLRRTLNPAILMIDAKTAVRDGSHFYKATDKVYLCEFLKPKYIKLVQE